MKKLPLDYDIYNPMMNVAQMRDALYTKRVAREIAQRWQQSRKRHLDRIVTRAFQLRNINEAR